jgi:peptidoglycan/xylan/chitin deacetylase (PgdA/CDA1 family)
VSLADGVESVGNGGHKQLVAITFDDGFRNFYEGVWPILEEHQVPVTLFVPCGFIATTSPSPLGGVELPPCSWAQLRELVSSNLVTIGSHSCAHPDLRALGREQLALELRDSRDRLEDELGVSVSSFCYPRALWNRRVEQEVMGVYDLAVIGGGRRITSANLNPHRLWRTSVRRDSSLSVEQWLRGSVWLEEAAADVVRRLR